MGVVSTLESAAEAEVTGIQNSGRSSKMRDSWIGSIMARESECFSDYLLSGQHPT